MSAQSIMDRYAPAATTVSDPTGIAARRNSKSVGAKAGAPSATAMSEAQLKDLKQIFEWLDVSGDGNVQTDELLIALKSIDPASTRADAEKLIREATGGKAADKLGWEDFCAAFSGMTQSASSQEMFALLDTTNTGQLGPAALKAALEKYGMDASEAAVDKMVRYADANNDGQVSLQEFSDALARETGVAPAI